MAELDFYQKRRDELRARHLPAGHLHAGHPSDERPPAGRVGTGGVDHLALICADLEATIQFYTEIIGMRLTRIVENRDEPTSTHIFLDMGGGNQLAFFDFPEKGPARTIRGVGSMHHVALKADGDQFKAILDRLIRRQVAYSLHGSPAAGSIYIRDPDDILVEITTGY